MARFSSEFVTHYEDIFFYIREDNSKSNLFLNWTQKLSVESIHINTNRPIDTTVFDLNLVIEYCSGGSLWNKLLSKRDAETNELDFVPLVVSSPLIYY